MSTAHQYAFAMVDADLDNNPKIRRAGRDAREVYQFVLRRNRHHGATGSIPAREVEPWYLADRLMAPELDMSRGVTACIANGLLALEGDRAIICGWDEYWARRPMTDSERKQKQRDKTQSHGVSRDVTLGHESHVLEKSREEKSREEEIGRAAPLAPSVPLETLKAKVDAVVGEVGKRRARKPEHPLPTDWLPTPEHRALALERSADLALEARKFRAHAETHDRRAVRWNAAFTQWLLGSRGSTSGPSSALDRQLERVRMLEAQEAAP